MIRMLNTIACVGGAAIAAAAADWTHVAGDPARSSRAPRGPAEIADPLWHAEALPEEEFVGQAPVVADGQRVIALVRVFEDSVHVANRVVAFDAAAGQRLWDADTPADAFDSRSGPAIDTRNGTLLVAVADVLLAVDLESGDLVWETPLDGDVVNASPAVTTDLLVGSTHANRALITDSSGFGEGARLYAVNVDPFHPTDNPHQPGDIAWQADIGGANGATPAYADGVVVVTGYATTATAGEPGPLPGEIRAFEASSGASLWTTPIEGDDGFFAGATIRDGAVYAATYDFDGGQDNSRLVKLDFADGTVVWSTPCERTSSIPVVAGDGRVYLSGGIAGFGSRVKIQAFEDHGSYASLIWDTYTDTDGDLIIGSWTYQPAFAFADNLLYAGAPSGSFFGAFAELLVIDPARSPGDPDFILDGFAGAGGSPALTSSVLYSLGDDGLFAFPVPGGCVADIDDDGEVGLTDLSLLLAVYGSGAGDPDYDPAIDLDGNGEIGLGDLSLLLAEFGTVCEDA